MNPNEPRYNYTWSQYNEARRDWVGQHVRYTGSRPYAVTRFIGHTGFVIGIDTAWDGLKLHILWDEPRPPSNGRTRHSTRSAVAARQCTPITPQPTLHRTWRRA